MLSRKLIVSTCAAAMFLTMNVGSAMAQSMVADSRTEFTFKAPVELPGVTLPPGAYVFRFVDPNTSRQVIQVLAKDDSKKTYGLFLTIQTQRPKASDKAELRFLETPVGQPVAVKTWWYPGNSIGREFIYPKSQARRLAIATKTAVLTTKQENVSNEQMSDAELAYVSPSGQEFAAIDPTFEEMEMMGAAGPTSKTLDRTPVQAAQTAANTSRRRLPRTDGMLPLMALMGLTSLAAGAAFRFRR